VAQILAFIGFTVAAGSFVGGVLSSGVVIAYLHRAEAKLKAELGKAEHAISAVEGDVKKAL
jgi:hypothetical protein